MLALPAEVRHRAGGPRAGGPVLRRVPALEARAADVVPTDPQELRAKVLGRLREVVVEATIVEYRVD